MLVIFITVYVALSEMINSVFLAIIALLVTICIMFIVINMLKLGRKGRKRIVYFRYLLEYQLSNKITKQ